MQTEQLLSHQNLFFSNAISKAIIVISTSQISKSNGQYPQATNNALCECMQNIQYHAFIGHVEGKRCMGDGCCIWWSSRGAGGGVRVEPHPRWTQVRTGS